MSGHPNGPSAPLALDAGEGGETWMTSMRRGDFTRAWNLSDRRLGPLPDDEWRKPRHEQRVWTGAPIDGQRVLVRCYHGLGDTIQFCRYLPLVAARARAVTVWAQPALLELLTPADGRWRVSPLHDGTPEDPYDVDIEIMELPHLFRSTLDTLPASVPYLFPPSEGRPATGDVRVGLTWQAGGWDPRRSIPFADLTPMLETSGVDLLALQPSVAPHEARLAARCSGDRSITSLASLITTLDVVVTVDTMVAHLAGALGKPTHILLHAAADWRWMDGRRDSPWYPTATLHRQSEPGDWRPVVDEVVAALRARVERRGTR